MFWIDTALPEDSTVVHPSLLSGANLTISLPSADNALLGARPTVRSAALRGSPPPPPASVIATLQVGIQPQLMIHLIDKVLAPTYVTVWQHISSQPGFESLAALLRAEGSTLSSLQNPSTSVTLLAPTNQALAALAQRYGKQANLSSSLDQAALRELVRNHIITKPLSYSALSQAVSLDTLTAPSALRVAVTGGVLNISSNWSTAKVMTPSNVSILYGRSYIHAVDFVLLTKSTEIKSTDGDGGAASAAAPPSLLLLLLAGLLTVRLALGTRWPLL